MSYKLSNTDYKKILEYYGEPVPTNNTLLQKNAEDIMALKLCSCIKKVGASNSIKEARSIGICTKTIFKRKGLKRTTFTCKKKKDKSQQMNLTKISKKSISIGSKTKKNVTSKK